MKINLSYFLWVPVTVSGVVTVMSFMMPDYVALAAHFQYWTSIIAWLFVTVGVLAVSCLVIGVFVSTFDSRVKANVKTSATKYNYTLPGITKSLAMFVGILLLNNTALSIFYGSMVVISFTVGPMIMGKLKEMALKSQAAKG